MKVRATHSNYIAKKVTDGLFANDHIFIDLSPKEIQPYIQEVLEFELSKEEHLDKTVNEKLDNLSDDISDEFEYMDINYRQVFFMVKKKLAKEFDFILNEEERYNHIAHQIVLSLTNQHLIDYNMSDTLVKNLVFEALINFKKLFHELDGLVHQKMTNYKRKLIPGTEDYNLIYDRLYEEELVRSGLK